MRLAAGTRLGPHEITSLLGVGGMGEVYLAHDTRLGRDVAIKVIPAGLTRDPEQAVTVTVQTDSQLERSAKFSR